jgi:hypothetical protein
MANDVTHAPSGSSPSNAGQLPLGFWTRCRKSWTRCAESERNPRATAARHEGSSAACLDVMLVAHPPDGSCLRASSSRKRPRSSSLDVTCPLVIAQSDLVKRTPRALPIERRTPNAATRARSFVLRQQTRDWLRKSWAMDGLRPLARISSRLHPTSP